jgi:hypothetical protein
MLVNCIEFSFDNVKIFYSTLNYPITLNSKKITLKLMCLVLKYISLPIYWFTTFLLFLAKICFGGIFFEQKLLTSTHTQSEYKSECKMKLPHLWYGSLALFQKAGTNWGKQLFAHEFLVILNLSKTRPA